MSNIEANRSNESNKSFQITRASVMFMAVLVMGYAVSTQVESAVEAPVAAAGARDGDAGAAPSAYFPAQYVNQGREAEEHIQAF